MSLQPPNHLGRVAKAQFRRVQEILGLGLKQSDGDALALYAVTYERWLLAESLIKEHGLTIVSPNGYPQQSPWLSISNDCHGKLVVLLRELGMTPHARGKLKPEPEVEDDPLQVFLRSG